MGSVSLIMLMMLLQLVFLEKFFMIDVKARDFGVIAIVYIVFRV